MSLLELRQVSRRFGGIQALSGVSLEVGAGETVGLIGPNGAGKTTLFDCISGTTRPDAGTIFFDGARIDRLPVHRRARRGIGRTFQKIELFAGTSVRDHLLVAARQHHGDGRLWKDLLWRGAPTEEELEEAEAMLKALGLEQVAGAPVEAISLGQGRLLELGRALIQRPRLLLLDEPSSGLDSRETDSLASVLSEVQREQGTAMLLVEHDLDLVDAIAGRVYVLDFGRVICSGRLAEVLDDAAVRTAYLGSARG
ncbi:MAG TPA: ABC transporter ATP-binding protein [Acidimicrobiales bacterium]|nr:ABC transporter ATP-binding protein [Acidimicrobiales bacterium]